MVKRVILASPRGFCAGVVRAIDVVRLALQTYGRPIYVRKEIVHNRHVVEELRQQGAIFVDDVEQVPEGERIVFSAHGVSPEVWQKARTRSLRIIDATCPLVTKVHMEAIRYARKDFTILLIGHAGHDEVIGTRGEAPERIELVSTVRDVERLRVRDPEKVAYITQTTLSLTDTRQVVEALKQKFPRIQGPPSADICYATENRQMAVRRLARQADLILVVGAVNSSNSNRLVEEACRLGTRAHLIDDVTGIEAAWLAGAGTVGLTSGASAPETLVHEIVDFFQAAGAAVEELVLQEENVHFALPANLLVDLQVHQGGSQP